MAEYGNKHAHADQKQRQQTQGMLRFNGCRLLLVLRFAHPQSRGQTNRHHGRHHPISIAPCIVQIMRLGRTPVFRQQQAACTRRNQPQPVAHGVGGRHYRLHGMVVRRNFNAVGIDNDVLRGRRKTEQHRRHGHGRQLLRILRVDAAHGDNGGYYQHLRQKQPGAAFAQHARKIGQRQAVNQRRPHEFERIAQGRPAEHGHGFFLDARFAQP